MSKINSEIKDLLIIGQGIAGTLLGYQAFKNNISFDIYDKGALSSASAVSSGIINPVTGSKFVKSWMIDQLLPVARQTYKSLEKLLDIKIVYEFPLWHHLADIQAENTWDGRLTDPFYNGLISRPDDTLLQEIFTNCHHFGRVDASLRIDIRTLLKSIRAYWMDMKILTEEEINTSELEFQNGLINYQGVHYKNCINASGYKGNSDLLFKSEDYRPVKGEVLICEIDGLPADQIIKYGKFIVPVGPMKYWIGSNYIKSFNDEKPDQNGIGDLISFLDNVIMRPYRIIEHVAGIRPATKFRRPFVGPHKQYSNLYLFNGLGTKGVSLAPYFSLQLIQSIINGESFATEAYMRSFKL